MMTAVWKALIAQEAQKISNGYLAVGDGVLDVPYDKVKNSGQPLSRGCHALCLYQY